MTSTPAPSLEITSLLESITGATVGSARLQEVCAAYAPILAEIAKLRTLELGDTHPAVIFEPTAAYRRRVG
jgi:hypothetical protein